MTDHYVLVDGRPVKADVLEWGRWYGTHGQERIVAKTTAGDSNISTVFLGLDHQFEPGGPPLIYETMVFGGLYDQDQERYGTPEEALAGHEAMVARVNLGRAVAFAFVEAPR